eukprot:CAMPEP_0179087176 /NCGR_PEP_ID=MMETSP0796-20121207/39594_1 /TAXON_ID=73915 /ORGANISM="Pyrodinium bahamense, Strain pbaha01" /LENGTH=213 /DNA_ID=CAMNT_0020784677 /DNA_START=54 /DNA_END=695 /DNA_ORIENTATION=+
MTIMNIEHKVPRVYETDLAYIGERYDVLSRIARAPARPSYATPDDGFNEKFRTSSVDFADPASRPEFSKGHESAPCLITTENAPVCPPERRSLPGPRSGFGAYIHRHGDNHDQRFFNTSTGDFFGGEGTRRAAPRTDPSTLRAAGLSLAPLAKVGRGVVHSSSDSALSIPLGDGEMSRIRADLEARKGRLYRQATYITKGKQHRNGVSVWQDY